MMNNRCSRIISSDVNPRINGVYWFDTKNNELNLNGKCLIKNDSNMTDITNYPFITMNQLNIIPKARFANASEMKLYEDLKMSNLGNCFAIDIQKNKLPTMVDVSIALHYDNNTPIVIQIPWFIVKGPNNDDVAFCNINVEENIFMFAYKKNSNIVFCCLKDNVQNTIE